MDARDIHETDAKTLKRHQVDYTSFNTEQRSFFANDQGWNYTDFSGRAPYDWDALIGVAYKQRVITLMTASGHYHLPRSALDSNQLAALTHWLYLAGFET